MSGSRSRMERLANAIWYGDSLLRFLLLPLSLLFAVAVAARRGLYRLGILRSYRAPLPVIVVGNISVGGTGKTPVTLWLVRQLSAAGMAPAIISRGYGGAGSNDVLRVSADSDPEIVGDEPLLLAIRSGVPVFVDRNRVRAAKAASDSGANVIISDDGLQHYALQRDAEVIVIDGQRGFGNGYMLPAGPLREPSSRLAAADCLMVQLSGADARARYGNRATDKVAVSRFSLQGDTLRQVAGEAEKPVSEVAGKTVRAVAGIGNPQRFFDYLASKGIDAKGVALADHAAIEAQDICFDDELDVIMTEKDAVKCRTIASDRHWYLPVTLELLDNESEIWLDILLSRISAKSGNAE